MDRKELSEDIVTKLEKYNKDVIEKSIERDKATYEYTNKRRSMANKYKRLINNNKLEEAKLLNQKIIEFTEQRKIFKAKEKEDSLTEEEKEKRKSKLKETTELTEEERILAEADAIRKKLKQQYKSENARKNYIKNKNIIIKRSVNHVKRVLAKSNLNAEELCKLKEENPIDFLHLMNELKI